MDRVSVIIAAGGRSQRMEGVNKQLALLRGVPVIARSMMVFQGLEEVGEIIVSARPEDMDTIENIAMIYVMECCAYVLLQEFYGIMPYI